MKQTWRRVLLVLVCCVLAFVGWVGLLRLADTISAARSYKSSPAELRAAADAAVLPAADPAFTGNAECTDAEQAEAQAEYYASIGGDPLDVEPLEPIVGDFVSFLPGTLPAEAPAISGATGDSIQHVYLQQVQRRFPSSRLLARRPDEPREPRQLHRLA